MELVYLDGKKEPYTTHDIIAECAEVENISVRKLIDKHKSRLERFGVLSFEIHKPEKGSVGGRPRKVYRLNEQQATLLVTYLGNTEPVLNFKTNLVKAFFEMRDEVAEFRLQRALEKPRRKTLTEAIKCWENAPKHAYSSMTNLLLKGATGRNKAQLMKERDSQNAIDSLTSAELIAYQRFEEMAIALINLNRSYSEIKELVFKPQVGNQA